MRTLSSPLWLLSTAALTGVAVMVAALAVMSESRGADRESFMAQSRVAMTRMMADMNILPSGDPDRDFARMMIAHHRGAIEMARVELGHGRDERLRRIAQGIIVEQQQEVEAMSLVVGPAALAPSGTMCIGLPPPPPRPILTQRAIRGDVVNDTP